LLVVAEDRERAGSVARHHGSRHQHVAVDGALAAKRAALNVHDGTASCSESSIHTGATRRLRVIRADVKRPPLIRTAPEFVNAGSSQISPL